MLTITQPAANRIDIDLSGQVDAAQMREGLDALLSKSQDVKSGRMLYTIKAFAMPTFGALGIEMQYLPQLFGLLGRFDKCAVVSDEGWLRRAAEIEGALFPGIAIRAFTPDEVDAAESWLAE